MRFRGQRRPSTHDAPPRPRSDRTTNRWPHTRGTGATRRPPLRNTTSAPLRSNPRVPHERHGQPGTPAHATPAPRRGAPDSYPVKHARPGLVGGAGSRMRPRGPRLPIPYATHRRPRSDRTTNRWPHTRGTGATRRPPLRNTASAPLRPSPRVPHERPGQPGTPAHATPAPRRGAPDSIRQARTTFRRGWWCGIRA